tara:strand:- start:1919 stop:3235 length:1317 start_codon:yes stop_codon:yes gene_type:complete
MEIFQKIIQKEIVWSRLKEMREQNKDIKSINKKLFALYPMFFFTTGDKFKSKFNAFKNNIIDNEYIGDLQRKLFIDIFYKTQKKYRALCFFSNLYKFKKTKKFDNDVDIRLNKLSLYPKNQKIFLKQNSKIYEFRLSDLLNIWVNSIEKHIGFYPDPCYPQNPYNRIEFTKIHLYNIYFALIKTNFFIPTLIHNFFHNHFDVDSFKYSCYPQLKESTIENNFKIMTSYTRFLEIITMLETRRTNIGFTFINNECREDKKVEIVYELSSYLLMHFKATESCNPIKKKYYNEKCNTGLKEFFQERPLFGRSGILGSRVNTTSSLYRRSTTLPPLRLQNYTSRRSRNLIEEIDALQSNYTNSLLSSVYNSTVTNVNVNLFDPSYNILEDENQNPEDPMETIEEEIQEEVHNDVIFTDDDEEILLETPMSVFNDSLESDDDL